MKNIIYNPETNVLVPREPTQAMCSAALAFENNKPLNEWGMIVFNTYEETYSAMLAAAPQPEPNHNWCAGCSPDNCSGCGAAPVDSEPVEYLLDGARFKLSFQEIECDECGTESPYVLVTPLDQYANELNGKWVALVQAENDRHLHITPQPDRTAELEAALKVARDAIDALQNGLKWYQDAYPDSISEADHEEIAKVDAAIDKINEVLKPEPVESEPVIIKEPNYHFEAMGCGLEDRDITDRYEAMQYGWDCAISRMFEQIPDEPLYTAPQHDRTAELEAALKVARDALIDCEGALDECRGYPITYDTVIETIVKINDVLK